MKRVWMVLWTIAAFLPLILQSGAILLPIEGGMLSETVIPWIMSLPPALQGLTFSVYVVFVSWLGWHWWFEYRNAEEDTSAAQQDRDILPKNTNL